MEECNPAHTAPDLLAVSVALPNIAQIQTRMKEEAMHESADSRFLARAERHVRECENRIARQLAYIQALEMHRDLPAAEQAKRQLLTTQHSLELARNDVGHVTLNRQSTATRAQP